MSIPYSAQEPLEVHRTALLQRFDAVRSQTHRLTTGLSPEDCTPQSMDDTSPVKWHLAHTTWFFEVFILERFEKNFKPFDRNFRILFNSYYNGIGEKFSRPERGLISRPSLSQVVNYRKNVEERMHALIANSPIDKVLADLTLLGIHHEQQHQELILTDLKHLLSRNPQYPEYAHGWPLVSAVLAPSGWQAFEGGVKQIGFEQSNDFCFDNEQPRHSVFIHPFELATQPVSYGDVIDFIEDEGYNRPELWLSAGWNAVSSAQWKAPEYWIRSAGDLQNVWHTFTLRGLCEISRDVPVAHLSYFEADAIARWKNARLPTEAEWEIAATHQQHNISDLINHGNLLETALWHPLVLQHAPKKETLSQLFGDVWEWTSSNYNAYPGFKTAAGAVGEYNGKFMCNQFVLRGGSCVTPRSHIRATYRNFFPPAARWQFSGLRLARDLR
jgi:ergothioneine biosynthesis protein EgtB